MVKNPLDAARFVLLQCSRPRSKDFHPRHRQVSHYKKVAKESEAQVEQVSDPNDAYNVMDCQSWKSPDLDNHSDLRLSRINTVASWCLSIVGDRMPLYLPGADAGIAAAAL